MLRGEATLINEVSIFEPAHAIHFILFIILDDIFTCRKNSLPRDKLSFGGPAFLITVRALYTAFAEPVKRALPHPMEPVFELNSAAALGTRYDYLFHILHLTQVSQE